MARSSNLYILILSLYWQVFAGAILNVTQTPKNLSVANGDKFCVNCSWKAEDQNERIRVLWKTYYESASAADNGTVLLSVTWVNNTSVVIKKYRNQSDYQLTKDEAQLCLFSVSEGDAGNYICEVTIDKPELRSGKGEGTTLYVTESSSSPELAYLAMFIIIPAVISLGYFLFKRRKQETFKEIQLVNQRAPEAVELHEMNENVNDGEDSSSSNSVTWAVSTLYESCDYFAMKIPMTPEEPVYSLAT